MATTINLIGVKWQKQYYFVVRSSYFEPYFQKNCTTKSLAPLACQEVAINCSRNNHWSPPIKLKLGQQIGGE